MEPFSLLLGLFSLAAGMAGLAVNNNISQSNIDLQKDTNQTNIDLANTQYQRSKEDAVKAGFSPLVATGINPSNAVVSAPQNNSGADITSLLTGMSSNMNSIGVEAMKEKHQSDEGDKNRSNALIINREKMDADSRLLAKQLAQVSSENEKERILKENLQKLALESNERINNENIGAKREEFNKEFSLKLQEIEKKWKMYQAEWAKDTTKMRISHDEFVATNMRQWVLGAWDNVNGTIKAIRGI